MNVNSDSSYSDSDMPHSGHHYYRNAIIGMAFINVGEFNHLLLPGHFHFFLFNTDSNFSIFNFLQFVVFFGCSGVVIALGLLVYWHSKLIYRGETSIEAHINASEVKRLQPKDGIYRNPYDFNGKRNFELFLGLTDGR